MLALVFALTACGSPAHGSLPAATREPAGVQTATMVTPTVFAGTPTALRIPALPMEATCRLILDPATPTAVDLVRAHGNPVSCYQLDRSVVLGAPGGADARPGFLACERPPAATDPFCGVGLGPVVGHDRSYSEHWQFIPFPAAAAKEVGLPVFPQQYQCVGDGSQMWTFHFDTQSYTISCHVVDFSKLQHVPCDVFLYADNASLRPLYRAYGKPAACATFGSTVVGVLDDDAKPGLLVCDAPSSSDPEGTFTFCGLGSIAQPLMTSNWQFTPLPVSQGPVDSATFDTADGTACVTAGGQPFTFTLATRAFAPGCGAAPSVTPAVEATTTP